MSALPPAYRADIDGLRALAVLAVVGFHAFPSAFPGGFIGVDVFFAISGYLISAQLYGRTDWGELAAFYARRVRRIVPALLLVLACTLALGWGTLFADEYLGLAQHILAGAAFVSNLLLWHESGYFDTAAQSKPLLHLWSLGIEEQFYLVWPLLLALCHRRRYALGVVIPVLIVASALLNLSWVHDSPESAFFSPLSRFWALLAGAWLAWLHRPGAPARPQDRRLAGRLAELLPDALALAGMALLLWGLVHISERLPYPGHWAAVPVLATVLLIAAGPRAWINRQLLARTPLVAIGLISFPLYLWHWPLMAFGRVVLGRGADPAMMSVLVALSLLLAWATYRWLEVPLRRRPAGLGLTSILLGLLACVGLMGHLVVQAEGYPARAAAVQARHQWGAAHDGGDGNLVAAVCPLPEAERRNFSVCGRDRRDGVKLALIGDSKATALFPGLVRTSHEGRRWMYVGGNGPDGAVVPVLSDDPLYAGHQRASRIAIDLVARDPEVDTVLLAFSIRGLYKLDDGIVSGNIRNYDSRYLDQLRGSPNQARAQAALGNTIARLRSAGKRVVILIDNPALPEPRDCIRRVTAWAGFNALLAQAGADRTRSCSISRASFEQKTEPYRQMLRALQAEFPDTLTVFDATALLCGEAGGTCGLQAHGRPLYAYTDHLSDYAAGLVGRALNTHLAQRH